MYKCKYCGAEFENRFKCSGHASRCSSNPTMSSTHECEYCGKTIIGKHSFTQHVNHCEFNPNKLKHKSPSRLQVESHSLTCCYCGKECRNDNVLRNHERLCKSNPNRVLPSEVNGHKGGWPKGKPAWNKGLTKETDARVAAHSTMMQELYSSGKLKGNFTGRKHTQETKDKISAAHLKLDHDQFNKNSHGKRGWLDNMFFMSTWELAYYLFMKDKGHTIVRCPQKFEYVDSDNKPHTYTPDFLVDDTIIVEIKGYETDHDRFKYTLVPDLVVIGEKDIDPYLQYVYKTYETRDLETLYDKVPDVIS